MPARRPAHGTVKYVHLRKMNAPKAGAIVVRVQGGPNHGETRREDHGGVDLDARRRRRASATVLLLDGIDADAQSPSERPKSGTTMANVEKTYGMPRGTPRGGRPAADHALGLPDVLGLLRERPRDPRGREALRRAPVRDLQVRSEHVLRHDFEHYPILDPELVRARTDVARRRSSRQAARTSIASSASRARCSAR